MGKRLAAVGAAAAIGLGGLAVAAVNPLGVAGAQDAPSSAPAAPKAERDGPLQRALDALVADGTLTEAQAAEVRAAVGHEVEDGKAARKDRRAEILQVVADAIGSTPAEVKAGLVAGTSIADQAKAEGVDRQVVDDALTKALTGRIAAAVEAGTLTQERADKVTAKLDGAVDKVLDADGSHRRHRPRG